MIKFCSVCAGHLKNSAIIPPCEINFPPLFVLFLKNEMFILALLFLVLVFLPLIPSGYHWEKKNSAQVFVLGKICGLGSSFTLQKNPQLHHVFRLMIRFTFVLVIRFTFVLLIHDFIIIRGVVGCVVDHLKVHM